MNIDYDFKYIAAEAIDADNHEFLVRFPFPPPSTSSLSQSIRDHGLLQPIIVRQRGNRFQLIDGFQRVSVTPYTPIPAMILPEKTPDLECLKIAVLTRSKTDLLNEVEIGQFLHKLETIDPSHSIVHGNQWLSLELTPKLAKDYERLSHFSKKCQYVIVFEMLPRKTWLLFDSFSTKDQDYLADFISQYQFGRNKIRELLTLIEEICLRDEISVTEFLNQIVPPISEEMSAKPVPQQAEYIRLAIRHRRYPQISAHLQKYDELAKNLRLPPHIHLTPPTDFEGTRFNINFQFSTIEGYRKIVDKLTDIAGQQELNDILTLI